MTHYFQVRNFETFQHYKDRNPPWIKLYNSLLEDYEFSRLTDTTKSHIVLIWLLASRCDNKMPFDQRWIKSKTGINEDIDFDELLENGYIEEYKSDREKNDWPSRYIPKKVKEEIYKKYNKKCAMCSTTENLEIDHIIPISKGGDGSPENLQVLCRSCNRKKRVSISAEQHATHMRSPEQSREEREKSKEDKKKIQKKERFEQQFEQWWELYGYKKSKDRAWPKFRGILSRNEASFEEIMAGTRLYLEKRGNEPRYWKHPATWLNGGCWKDEYLTLQGAENETDNSSNGFSKAERIRQAAIAGYQNTSTAFD